MKKTRKLIIGIGVLCVFMCLMAFSASAATSGKYTYYVWDDEASITEVDTSISGNITIPKKLGGYPVTDISYEAFKNCKKLTGVTIDKNIKYVSSSAFTGCTNLKKINVNKGNKHFKSVDGVLYRTDYENELVIYPAGKTASKFKIPVGTDSISYDAFINCTNLKKITVPASVNYIDAAAFSGCTRLKEIIVNNKNAFYDSIDGVLFSIGYDTISLQYYPLGKTATSYKIPEGTQYIGASSFEGNKKLKSVTIPETVTYIDWAAFNNCTALKKLTIPDSVTTISGYAFEGCKNLESIKLSKNLEEMYYGAFAGCSKLKSITLPAKVTHVNPDAFEGCDSFKKININKNNKNFSSDGSAIFNKNKTKLIFFYNKTAESYKIPKKVKNIGDLAFVSTKLKKVTIPSSVTQISYAAFLNCKNLKSAALPSKLKTIGTSAFGNCPSLKKVTIPKTVKTVGEFAFQGCTGLEELTLSNGIESLSYYAFQGCTALEEITIPKSLEKMDDTFVDCTNLKTIKVQKGSKYFTVDDGILYDKDKLYLYIYPAKKTDKTFTVPKSVDEISAYAFKGNSYLTEIKMSKGLRRISYNAFENCKKLKSLSLPSTVTDINYAAFAGCTGLKEVKLPSKLMSLQTAIFLGCKKLEKIDVPDTLKEISFNCFGKCSGLDDVYYEGTKTQWKKIEIDSDNEYFTSAKIHYNADI